MSKDNRPIGPGRVTIPQLAHLLGISRIAVYKRVKRGEIPAVRLGSMYVISDRTIASILGREASPDARSRIDAAVRRTVSQYGEVLKRLGKE